MAKDEIHKRPDEDGGFPPLDEQVEVIRRGVVEITPEEELVDKLKRSREENRPLRVKLGVDPTAGSLHLGFTVVLRKLRQFQELGHQAVLIIGDATAQVGDPSGRDVTRPMLTTDEVRDNARSYLDQVDRLLDLDSLEVVYNGDWFRDMRFEEVMRLAGQVTVAQMIERDDFEARMEEGSPISLHEFFYPVMQAWDSVQVRADIELGGTDQKFNLLAGRDMQRSQGQEPQVAVLTPLLEGTDGSGRKMSKSYDNTVAIDDEPNDMYGRVMRITDEMMRDWFMLLTDIPEAEVDELLDGHPREAKARLAREIVTQYHGAEDADQADEEFRRVFSSGRLPSELTPIELEPADLEDGRIGIIALIVKADFAGSNSEARRLVEQGAVTYDDDKVDDVKATVEARPQAVLQVGKRRVGQVVLKD